MFKLQDQSPIPNTGHIFVRDGSLINATINAPVDANRQLIFYPTYNASQSTSFALRYEFDPDYTRLNGTEILPTADGEYVVFSGGFNTLLHSGWYEWSVNGNVASRLAIEGIPSTQIDVVSQEESMTVHLPVCLSPYSVATLDPSRNANVAWSLDRNLTPTEYHKGAYPFLLDFEKKLGTYGIRVTFGPYIENGVSSTTEVLTHRITHYRLNYTRFTSLDKSVTFEQLPKVDNQGQPIPSALVTEWRWKHGSLKYHNRSDDEAVTAHFTEPGPFATVAGSTLYYQINPNTTAPVIVAITNLFGDEPVIYLAEWVLIPKTLDIPFYGTFIRLEIPMSELPDFVNVFWRVGGKEVRQNALSLQINEPSDLQTYTAVILVRADGKDVFIQDFYITHSKINPDYNIARELIKNPILSILAKNRGYRFNTLDSAAVFAGEYPYIFQYGKALSHIAQQYSNNPYVQIIPNFTFTEGTSIFPPVLFYSIPADLAPPGPSKPYQVIYHPFRQTWYNLATDEDLPADYWPRTNEWVENPEERFKETSLYNALDLKQDKPVFLSIVNQPQELVDEILFSIVSALVQRTDSNYKPVSLGKFVKPQHLQNIDKYQEEEKPYLLDASLPIPTRALYVNLLAKTLSFTEFRQRFAFTPSTKALQAPTPIKESIAELKKYSRALELHTEGTPSPTFEEFYPPQKVAPELSFYQRFLTSSRPSGPSEFADSSSEDEFLPPASPLPEQIQESPAPPELFQSPTLLANAPPGLFQGLFPPGEVELYPPYGQYQGLPPPSPPLELLTAPDDQPLVTPVQKVVVPPPQPEPPVVVSQPEPTALPVVVSRSNLPLAEVVKSTAPSFNVNKALITPFLESNRPSDVMELTLPSLRKTFVPTPILKLSPIPTVTLQEPILLPPPKPKVPSPLVQPVDEFKQIVNEYGGRAIISDENTAREFLVRIWGNVPSTVVRINQGFSKPIVVLSSILQFYNDFNDSYEELRRAPQSTDPQYLLGAYTELLKEVNAAHERLMTYIDVDLGKRDGVQRKVLSSLSMPLIERVEFVETINKLALPKFEAVFGFINPNVFNFLDNPQNNFEIFVKLLMISGIDTLNDFNAKEEFLKFNADHLKNDGNDVQAIHSSMRYNIMYNTLIVLLHNVFSMDSETYKERVALYQTFEKSLNNWTLRAQNIRKSLLLILARSLNGSKKVISDFFKNPIDTCVAKITSSTSKDLDIPKDVIRTGSASSWLEVFFYTLKTIFTTNLLVYSKTSLKSFGLGDLERLLEEYDDDFDKITIQPRNIPSSEPIPNFEPNFVIVPFLTLENVRDSVESFVEESKTLESDTRRFEEFKREYGLPNSVESKSFLEFISEILVLNTEILAWVNGVRDTELGFDQSIPRELKTELDNFKQNYDQIQSKLDTYKSLLGIVQYERLFESFVDISPESPDVKGLIAFEYLELQISVTLEEYDSFIRNFNADLKTFVFERIGGISQYLKDFVAAYLEKKDDFNSRISFLKSFFDKDIDLSQPHLVLGELEQNLLSFNRVTLEAVVRRQVLDALEVENTPNLLRFESNPIQSYASRVFDKSPETFRKDGLIFEPEFKRLWLHDFLNYLFHYSPSFKSRFLGLDDQIEALRLYLNQQPEIGDANFSVKHWPLEKVDAAIAKKSIEELKRLLLRYGVYNLDTVTQEIQNYTAPWQDIRTNVGLLSAYKNKSPRELHDAEPAIREIIQYFTVARQLVNETEISIGRNRGPEKLFSLYLSKLGIIWSTDAYTRTVLKQVVGVYLAKLEKIPKESINDFVAMRDALKNRMNDVFGFFRMLKSAYNSVPSSADRNKPTLSYIYGELVAFFSESNRKDALFVYNLFEDIYMFLVPFIQKIFVNSKKIDVGRWNNIVQNRLKILNNSKSKALITLLKDVLFKSILRYIDDGGLWKGFVKWFNTDINFLRIRKTYNTPVSSFIDHLLKDNKASPDDFVFNSNSIKYMFWMEPFIAYLKKNYDVYKQTFDRNAGNDSKTIFEIVNEFNEETSTPNPSYDFGVYKSNLNSPNILDVQTQTDTSGDDELLFNNDQDLGTSSDEDEGPPLELQSDEPRPPPQNTSSAQRAVKNIPGKRAKQRPPSPVPEPFDPNQAASSGATDIPPPYRPETIPLRPPSPQQTLPAPGSPQRLPTLFQDTLTPPATPENLPPSLSGSPEPSPPRLINRDDEDQAVEATVFASSSTASTVGDQLLALTRTPVNKTLTTPGLIVPAPDIFSKISQKSAIWKSISAKLISLNPDYNVKTLLSSDVTKLTGIREVLKQNKTDFKKFEVIFLYLTTICLQRASILDFRVYPYVIFYLAFPELLKYTNSLNAADVQKLEDFSKNLKTLFDSNIGTNYPRATSTTTKVGQDEDTSNLLEILYDQPSYEAYQADLGKIALNREEVLKQRLVAENMPWPFAERDSLDIKEYKKKQNDLDSAYSDIVKTINWRKTNITFLLPAVDPRLALTTKPNDVPFTRQTDISSLDRAIWVFLSNGWWRKMAAWVYTNFDTLNQLAESAPPS